MEMIQFINFKDLTSWGYGQLSFNNNYAFKYPSIKLARLIKEYKHKVILKDEEIYARVTIKVNNCGVVKRDSLFGKDIKTKGQFYIKKGQFIYSNIDARNGAFGVVPENLDGAIITNSFSTFECDNSLILPQYLELLLTTKYYIKIWSKLSRGTTNRRSVKNDVFLNVKIPVPSMEQQKEILARYNEKIEESKKLVKLSDYSEVDKEIFELLKMYLVKKTESINNTILETRKLSKLVTWGVSYNIGDSNPSDLICSQRYDNVSLNTVAEINPTTVMPNDDTEVTFLPMECISDIYGEIIEKRVKKVVKSKGFTRFQNGDIIWAKITPCMQNGKSAVMDNLLNGYGCGSTEFHVVRVNEKKVLKKYVYFLLRMIRVREAAKEFFTGSAGQQRVNKEFLEKLAIPLPSIGEQQKIVKILQAKKEEIKQNRKKAEELEVQAKQEFENTIFD